MPSVLLHRQQRPRLPPLHHFQPHRHQPPVKGTMSSHPFPRSDATATKQTRQIVPLSVTVVIITVCLVIVSLTVSSRLLSHDLLPTSSIIATHLTAPNPLPVQQQHIPEPEPPKTPVKPEAPPQKKQHDQSAAVVLPPIPVSPLYRDYQKVLAVLPTLKNETTTKKFIVYRAIGNDLPPRHSIGQTYDNIKFILENEPVHKDLERRWYFNRIINATEVLRLIDLMNKHNESFHIDLFNMTEYQTNVDYKLLFGYNKYDILRSHVFRQYSYANINERRLITDLLFLDKNQYIIHNNHARNKMIELGIQSSAKYVLPWDGNCFITTGAWKNITSTILSSSSTNSNASTHTSQKYFYTPMIRMTNNTPLLDKNYRPRNVNEEPQLIFRNDARERFNESLAYGCRPKVNMLIHLKVPGNYTHVDLNMVCIGLSTMVNMSKTSADVPERDGVRSAGWVARLFSGKKRLETMGAIFKRGLTRTDGVENIGATASLISAAALNAFAANATTLLYDYATLRANLHAYKTRQSSPQLNDLVGKLINTADFEMSNFSSFTDAAANAAAAPLIAAAPMLHLATQRPAVPDDVTREHVAKYAAVHTLAGLFTGDVRYVLRGKAMLHQLLVNSASRVPVGLQSSVQTNAYHMCVALDAVKLQITLGTMTVSDIEAIASWARKRLDYYDVGLRNDARESYFAHDSVGTFHELAVLCPAAFAQDARRMLRSSSLARPRMWEQFDLKTGTGWDDHMHGVVAWVAMAEASSKFGVDVWGFGQRAIHGGQIVLRSVIKFLVPDVLSPNYQPPVIVDDEQQQQQQQQQEVNTNDTMLVLGNSSVRAADANGTDMTTVAKRKAKKVIKLGVSKASQKVMAQYVWWVAHSRYSHVLGGFWGDSTPRMEDLEVAKSVHEAPEGMAATWEEDEVTLVPPFWNLAM